MLWTIVFLQWNELKGPGLLPWNGLFLRFQKENGHSLLLILVRIVNCRFISLSDFKRGWKLVKKDHNIADDAIKSFEWELNGLNEYLNFNLYGHLNLQNFIRLLKLYLLTSFFIIHLLSLSSLLHFNSFIHFLNYYP